VRRILTKLKKRHEPGLVPSAASAILYGAPGERNEALPGSKRLMSSATLNLRISECPAGV
jgi:hypothetical protein